LENTKTHILNDRGLLGEGVLIFANSAWVVRQVSMDFIEVDISSSDIGMSLPSNISGIKDSY
jgi:hypothetical protein